RRSGPALALEAREAEADLAFRSDDRDPHEPRGGRVAACVEQLFEGCRGPLGLASPLPVRHRHRRDRALALIHSPRIPASTLTTCCRIFSSRSLRTAPYSSGGTGRRKEPEPPRGSRM